MSTTIDQKVVEMRFDNKHFESNVQTTMGSLSRLKQSLNLNGATRGLEGIGSAVKNVTMSPLIDGVDRVQLKFSALYTFMDQTMRRITDRIINTGERMVKALTIDPVKQGFSEYETKINAVQTILSNTSNKGTTIDDVTKVLNELNTYADKTIYNFAEMTKNIGTFTAAGVGLEDSAAAIQGIANLAAASGSTSQQASTAMYQLSQALSSGTVKLMDWNSVVNAGMGGQKFQEALKATAREQGIAVDDMIEKHGSFRESLTEGWITADVLNTTLQKFTVEGAKDYGKAMMEMGEWTQAEYDALIKEAQAMEDAATKVKTFTQLWDTLKESAQSGWAQTWEIIIGDFEEAKETLSEFSKVMGGIIEASAKSRNELLQGWKDAGGRKDLIDSLFNVFYGIMNIVKPIKDAFREMFPPTTVNQLVNFTSKLKNLTQGFRDFFEEGGKNAENLKRTFRGIFAIFDIAKQAISAVVKAILPFAGGIDDLGSSILSTTATWGDWLVKLRDTIKESDIFGKTMQKIVGAIKTAVGAVKNFATENGLTFGNLVSSIKTAFQSVKDFGTRCKDSFKSIWTTVKEFAGYFKDGVVGAFKVVGAVASVVVSIFKGLGPVIGVVVDICKTGFAMVAHVFAIVGEAARQFAEVIKDRFVAPGLELFHALLGRVSERMEHVRGAAAKMREGIAGAFETVIDKLTNSGFFKTMQKIWEVIKKIGAGIAKFFGKAFNGLIDKIGNADFSSIIDLLNLIITGGIGVAIGKFLKSTTGVVDGITGVFEGLKDIKLKVVDVLDGFRGCFEAYQTQLKAGTLQKIAIAIAILAGSLLVISFIDSGKLLGATAAISVLFYDLVGAMGILDKMTLNKGSLIQLCASMIGIAIAVALLSTTLKKLADIEPERMVSAVLGVSALAAVMVGVAKLMENGGNKIFKGATQLVIFALAIKILASVCEDLSALSWGEIARGLVGVAGLMAAVAGFLFLAKFGGSSVSSAVGVVVLAAALKILQSVCKDFAQMNWEEIGKGLTAIGGLLVEVMGFMLLMNKAGNVMSSAVSLVVVGAALKIFASAAKDFGSMSWEEIGKSLVSMAVALFAVAIATKIMPNNMISVGVGLAVVGAALLIIAQALKSMGSMSWEGVAKSLITLCVTLAALALALNAMTAALPGAAALLVAAAALAVLTPVLATLGAMSWGAIIKGLVALVGVFAVLGIAGLVLTPLVPVILALAGACALIGLAVIGLGAGLTLAAAGFTALALAITAFASAGAAGVGVLVFALTSIVSGIAGLIPLIIRKFGEGLIALCEVIRDGAPAIGEAFKAVVLSAIDVLVTCVPELAKGILQILVGVAAALVEYTPEFVDLVFEFFIKIFDGIADRLPELIKSVVGVLEALFVGVIDALGSMDMNTLIGGIAGIGLLSGMMVALSAIAGLIPGAMLGVLGMAGVIAEMALLIAAFGALAQIPGLEWLVSEGGDFLEKIGTAIGQFVGGIAGGIAQGFTSSLPQMGTDLSAFMTNVTPFIEGAKNIDSTVLDGVKSLAGVVLALTAANVLEGLTSWFTGGSSLASFGAELAAFGPHFNAYYQAIKGVDPSVVAASACAAQALAAMASNIPNEGGVAAWFAGENSISKFGAEIIALGHGLKGFSDAVVGINPENMIAASQAGKVLADMTANIPNEGGVAAWFAGENSISKFGKDIIGLGKGLKGFSDAVVGIDPELVTIAAQAGKTIADMTKTLPNEGGVAAWFAGDNSISKFGNDIVSLGDGLKGFSDAVTDIKPNNVTSAANAAKALAEMTGVIPNSGGVKSWFTGDNSISKFGDELPKLGKGLKGFSDSVSGIVPKNVTAASTAAKTLAEMTNTLPKNTDRIDGFGDNLVKFGDSLKSYFSKTAGINKESISATEGVINAVEKAASVDSGNISAVSKAINETATAIKGLAKVPKDAGKAFKDALKDLGESSAESFVKALKSMKSDTKTAGKEAIEAFINGIKNQLSNAKGACSGVASACADAMGGKTSSFKTAGRYAVEGFAAGISENTYKATAKASAMAAAAAAAAKKELDEHSPSKVFYGIGDFAGKGFVNALSDYVSASYDAGSEMASSAREGLRMTLSKISDLVNSDIDTQPTIRPVLDLSDVQSGASAIGNMLGAGSSIGVRANVGAISSMMSQRGQNGSNADILSALKDLKDAVGKSKGDSYSFGNITYDDGSNIHEAVQTLVRAAKVGRRT